VPAQHADSLAEIGVGHLRLHAVARLLAPRPDEIDPDPDEFLPLTSEIVLAGGTELVMLGSEQQRSFRRGARKELRRPRSRLREA
jgi:hypothetical protein